MTIKEIAKLAGVSTATVSRALNGQPGVLPEKQQYILQLAKDLNYQPNVLAKGLSSKKSYTLGVAISDITNPFYGENCERKLRKSRRHTIILLCFLVQIMTSIKNEEL